jgi:glycosyltransferase involved in cell wall biosynthesis
VKDLVSVLIPAYNVERWIRQSLLSVLRQTWPRVEVIVVDDGSTDGTVDAARSIGSRAIKIVSQQNAGACAARNVALSHAQGTYIQWLDADDLLHPEKIARQLAGADSGLQSRTLITASWGRFFYRQAKARFIPDALWRDLSPVDWLVTKFGENVWMNPATWLVSRRLADAAGPWDERLARGGDDDGEYVCRVVAESDGVRFAGDARCYYRIGSTGSLNWIREQAEESLAPLVLSITLSVDHLLRLEDTPRTRAAALNFVRVFSQYFYSRSDEEFEPMRVLARRLGGTLAPPRVSWKYYPLEKLFGARTTKSVMNNWRAAKVIARRNLDRSLALIAR